MKLPLNRQLTISFRTARSSIVLLCAFLFFTNFCLAEQEQTGGPLRLALPAEHYAVSGVETSIEFDNIVLTRHPGKYRFRVKCDIGRSDEKRWKVTPTAGDVGLHPLTISVNDANGKQLGQATLQLRVVAANAGEGRSIKLLLIGDSLTHATHYPNEMARLLSGPGNPQWKMLGTHKPSGAVAGVAHEGYGGWTWRRFVSAYEPNPDGSHRKRSSPFVYLNKQNKPTLDVKRYFKQECHGDLPNFVIFKLGINDCYSADPNDPKKMDARISAMLKQADILVAAFRKAAPNAQLGICLTTPPNARESAFKANHKNPYPRWKWKRVQHRLVQRQLKHFSGREKEHIFIVPTQLDLDPVDGYPKNNAVHPNKAGYKQIGSTLYAWIKARLAADVR